MSNKNIYKEGIRKGLTFKTSRGVLSMSQLPSLSLTDLDKLAVDLQDQVENGKKKSFLVETTQANRTVLLKFEIVKDLLETIVEEQKIAKERADKRVKKQRILELIEEKKEGEMKEKSVDELEKLLQELEE